MSIKKKLNKWTSPEHARLRRLFAISTRDELAAAFPRHPIGSIIATAYDLGLRKDRGQPRWATIAAQHVPVFQFGRTA